jgi:tRNA(fMet)-specific endonuclease VapC
MKYMLDTNICSYIIKNRPLEVFEKFKSLQIEDCCISAITYADLKYWVAKNKRLHTLSKNQGEPKIGEQVINNFVSHLEVIEFGTYAGDIYGKIRDTVFATGAVVEHADLLIAAHALSLDSILVTNNIKDFKSIPDIKLENWLS